MLSVVIATIGRHTLEGSIESVVSQGINCVVVNDGVDMPPPKERRGLTYVTLGRNFGRMDGRIWYGLVAFSTGCFLSKTEFTMTLGDDDELLPGIVPGMCERIRSNPDIDIWVPGLQFNSGHIACCTPGLLQCGNVSHSIYRTKIIGYEPMYNRKEENSNVSDWHHVERCVNNGWKIDWLGYPCVLVRPQVPGHNGGGRLDLPEEFT